MVTYAGCIPGRSTGNRQNCRLPLTSETVAARRTVLAQVGEPIVSRHQPAPLTLDARPLGVRRTFRASPVHHSFRGVTAGDRLVGDLPPWQLQSALPCPDPSPLIALVIAAASTNWLREI